MRLPKKVSNDALWRGRLFTLGTTCGEHEEDPTASFSMVLERRLFLSALAKSTAAPSVIPVCPNTNILLSPLSNDNRQSSSWQLTEDHITASVTVEQVLELLPPDVKRAEE